MITTEELIVAVILFVVSAILALISVRQFKEKAFLFNNAYFLYASKTERERMDKKPYYRQSAIVFCLLSIVFLILGISLLFKNDKILMIEIPLFVGALIYAIVSSIRIEKSTRR